MQLLLLAACFPCLLAGLFDSYIVNSTSYLDVVRSSSSSKGVAAGAAAPSCSDSSTAACADRASRHFLDTAAQQAAADASTLHIETSTILQDVTAQSRSLLQAANPARLLPPYNVCVSSWAPMVRCTPEMEQSEYNGECKTTPKGACAGDPPLFLCLWPLLWLTVKQGQSATQAVARRMFSTEQCCAVL